MAFNIFRTMQSINFRTFSSLPHPLKNLYPLAVTAPTPPLRSHLTLATTNLPSVYIHSACSGPFR